MAMSPNPAPGTSLTRRQVRAVDRCAIERLGIAGAVLMENAGRQVAEICTEMLGGDLRNRRVAVVAGGGNNGGDGFVAARHVMLRGGRAEVFLLVPPEKLSGDAEVNYRIWRALGGAVHEGGELGRALADFELILDALGGTGIEGALRGWMAEAVEQINVASSAASPVLAVDIPTGLDCDTGEAGGPAVRAAATVTFVARKAGFDTPGSQAYTGEVRVADIGVPAGRVLEMLSEQGDGA
jgi:NAD(P)H-hydrate epimerase